MSADESGSIRLSDISDIGQAVPKGRYKGMLAQVNGKMSKGSETSPPSPMVEAVYDIKEGEYEGMTITLWHSLKISESTVQQGPNKGKKRVFAPGIMDFKAACAAVGKPLGDAEFQRNPTVEDAQKWAREYGVRFHPQHGAVEIAVLEENRKRKDADSGKWVDDLDDDGKVRKTLRARVVGPWKGQAATGEGVNALAAVGIK